MRKETAGTGGRALVRLLKALARPDAQAEIEEDAAGIRCVRVLVVGRGNSIEVVQHASAEAWRRAVHDGQVTAVSGTGHWQISAAGRARLAAYAESARSLEASACRPGTQAAGKSSSARATAGFEAVARTRMGDGEGSTARPGESHAESPLGWLYRRRDKTGARLISEAQFNAGERLRADYELGQLMPRLTVDYQRAADGGSGRRGGAIDHMEVSERALAARQRVARALSAVGPELASLLVDVCCHLKGLEQLERAAGWPQRSAKVVLQVGLSALARHYGMDRTGGDRAARTRTHHWGADGFRSTAFGPGAEGDKA